MRFLAFLPLVLLLGGCAQVAVDNEIRADGSLRRSLKFSSDDPTTTPSGPNKDKWKKRFTFQKTPGWKVRDAKDAAFDTPVVLADRDFAPGAAFEGDITVNTKSGKAAMRNVGKVVKRADGLIEYVETFTWVGPKPERKEISPAVRARVAKALPAGTSEAKIDRVFDAVAPAFYEAVFGMDDPIADYFISSREAALRRLKAKLWKGVRAEVSDDATASRVIDAMFVKSGDSDPMTDSGVMGSDSEGPTGMFVSLKGPGKALETNGRREDDGTVTWRFYAEGATMKDITLRAVYRP